MHAELDRESPASVVSPSLSPALLPPPSPPLPAHASGCSGVGGLLTCVYQSISPDVLILCVYIYMFLIRTSTIPNNCFKKYVLIS